MLNGVPLVLVGLIFGTLVWLVGGVFFLLVGSRRPFSSDHEIKPPSWYNRPLVLIGLSCILIALFLGMIVAWVVIPQVSVRFVVLLVAILCGCCSLLTMIRASQRFALLPRRRRRERTQPKE